MSPRRAPARPSKTTERARPSNTAELSGELSVGDVIKISTESNSHWLACDRCGWRQITEPFTAVGEPLSAATVYQHLADQRPTR